MPVSDEASPGLSFHEKRDCIALLAMTWGAWRMMITFNGEKKTVPDGITVLGLLEFLKVQQERVAVELNLEIVKKDKFGTTAIQEDDNLEVVSFMQGGS